MADAKFVIQHDRINEPQLLEAFSRMQPIELPELRDACERAKPIVLRHAREHGSV